MQISKWSLQNTLQVVVIYSRLLRENALVGCSARFNVQGVKDQTKTKGD